MEVGKGLAIVKDEEGNIDIVKNYQNLEKIEELKYKVNCLEEILADTKKGKKDFIYKQIGNMLAIGASTTVTLVGINSITESPTARLLSAGLVVYPFTLFLALQVYNEYNSKKYEFKLRIKYAEEVLEQKQKQLQHLLNRSKRLTDTSSYIEIDKSKIEKELIEIYNNLACLNYIGKDFKTYKNAYLDGILTEKLHDAKMENVEITNGVIDLVNNYIEKECYKRKYSM